MTRNGYHYNSRIRPLVSARYRNIPSRPRWTCLHDYDPILRGFRTDFRTPDIHKPRPIGLRGISRGFNLEHQYHHQHHGDRKGRSRNRDYAYERIFTQHLNRLFDVLLIHNSNRYFNFSLFFSLKLVISETTTSSPGSKPLTTSTYSKLLSPSCTFRLINWSPLTTNNSYSPFPT